MSQLDQLDNGLLGNQTCISLIYEWKYVIDLKIYSHDIKIIKI